MRVALKLLSVVIASPKATPEHFDAFKLFTLRWRGSSRFAHVIRNFEQINAERHFQSDTRNTSPIISEALKEAFVFRVVLEEQHSQVKFAILMCHVVRNLI